MRAVILLSGGLDSTVTLALALEKKRECLAVSFDYGQRHRIELKYARKIVKHYGATHRIIKIDPRTFSNSSLVNKDDVPKNRTQAERLGGSIPNTYVPARNTLFIAYAVGQAEIFKAEEIYAGPNLQDCNAYPDCRPEFYSAFRHVIQCATKQASEGNAPALLTPLIDWDKKQIAREAMRLGVPIEMTFSCYDPSSEGQPCRSCDACLSRKEALLNLGTVQ